MPRLIELDGVTHTFPDDATDAEIAKALGGRLAGAPAPAPAPAPAGINSLYEMSKRMRDQYAPGAPVPTPQAAGDYQSGMARTLAQGATLGASDEIIAGVKAAAGSGDYETNLANEREANKQFADQYPVSAMGGKVAGAVVGTVPIFRALPAVASALGRTGMAAGTGAAIGATEGFLSGEGGIENRADDAVKGAVVGGLAGGALQGGVEGVRAGVSAVKNYLRKIPDDERAAKLLQRALERDKTDMATVQSAASTRGADIIDVAGENTKRLARTVAAQPGEAANVQRDFVRTRGEQTYRDVNNAILQAFNPEDYALKLTRSIDRLQNNANKAYADAYKQTPYVRTPEIDAILNTPAGQQSMRNVLERVMPGQKSALGPVNPQSGTVEKYDLQTLRQIKSDLYARATGTNKLTGGNDEEAAYLKQLSGMLNAELKKASTPFRAAAEQYADEAQLIEAMKFGAENFTKMRPTEIKLFLKGKTPGEREMFMNGAYDALERQFLNGKNNRNFADIILNTPKIAENIKAAVTGNEWMQLVKNLRANSEKFATTQFVNSRSGSQTFLRAADDEVANMDGVGSMARAGLNVAQGQWGSALGNTMSAVGARLRRPVDRAGGLDEQSARFLADYLLRPAGSPEHQRAAAALLAAMPRAQQAAAPRKIVGGRPTAGLLGLIGP